MLRGAPLRASPGVSPACPHVDPSSLSESFGPPSPGVEIPVQGVEAPPEAQGEPEESEEDPRPEPAIEPDASEREEPDGDEEL